MASSSSSLIRVPHPQKVCLVCYRMAEYQAEYWIYIVDLNSAAGDYFTRRNPTFRIRHGCFSYPCFCVLGSTLYVFEGYTYDRDAQKYITRGKTVYTYPLPSSDTANLRLTRSMMFVAEVPLKEVKFKPTAIPTPDGKQILVVPTGFQQFMMDGSICSLELYDPLRKTSTVIRALPLEDSKDRVMSVKFIGPQTVLLRTAADLTHTGFLTLHLDDLQGPEPKWVDEWEWSRNFKRMRIQGWFLIRHGWCFTASRAHDFRDGLLCGRGRSFEYPASTASGDDLSSSIINYDITPLPDPDTFCTLRCGCTLRPFVMLDVYKLDHKEVAEVTSARVGEEMDARLRGEPIKRTKRSIDDSVHSSSQIRPGVEIVKSIRFFDAKQLLGEDDSFEATISFFSIP